MREQVMQYAWQTLRYEQKGLKTQGGQEIRIVQPGSWNFDQGPDFINAQIGLGDTRLFGHVELHVRGEEWYGHGHHEDPFYNPVVLHVVMEPTGGEVLREDGTAIPELCLGGRIDEAAAQHFFQVLSADGALPCGQLLDQVSPGERLAWLRELGRRRLDHKAQMLQMQVFRGRLAWDQVLWEGACRTLGGPVNGPAFQALARALPWRVVRRHVHQQGQLLALVRGAAGCYSGVHGPPEGRSEWQHWALKYHLRPISVPLKRHRMHPASQPERRLEQLPALAAWLHDLPAVWSLGAPMDLAAAPVGLGRDLFHRLLINAILPIGMAYRRAHGQDHALDQASALLEGLPAERNKVTRRYGGWGFDPGSALESQGVLALERHFCGPRHCLSCHIGQQVLRK